MNKPKLLSSTADFTIDVDQITRRHSQEISQEFLDDIRNARNASTSQREGDFQRVASIPVVIVEQWKREGFDVFKETPRAIIARLKQCDLQAFITTDKKV